MRLRFALTHLLSSCSVFFGVMALFFLGWFPHGYRELSGVTTLALWMLLVDVVVGPVCTFVVADPRKLVHERVRDFSIIVVLQIAALAYGVSVAWSARPALLVFEYSLFRLVPASEVASQGLTGVQQAEHVLGVPLLSLRPFGSPEEKLQMTLAAIAGYSLSARPELWASYSSAKQAVLAQARPVKDLVGFDSAIGAELALMTSLKTAEVGVLPVVGHQGACQAVAVSMRDAQVLGILSADVCSLKAN